MGAALLAGSSRAQVPDLPYPGVEAEELTSHPAHDLESVLGPMARRIPGIMERDGVPGLVVLVLRDAAPVASAAFGFADPAAERAMTVDAVFRVELRAGAWVIGAGGVDLSAR